MLRMSMGAESLSDVFKRMGKTVSKANAHQLGAIACAAPEIFMAPAMGPYHMYMVGDLRILYCLSRDIKQFSPFATLAGDVIRQYSIEDFTNADTLKAIFDALDEKIAEINNLLEKDGFPPLRL